MKFEYNFEEFWESVRFGLSAGISIGLGVVSALSIMLGFAYLVYWLFK